LIRKISNWFLSEYLADTPDYYERAKIRLTYNLAAIVFTATFPVPVALVVSGMPENAVISVVILAVTLCMPFILKYRRNVFTASLIFIVVVYGAITSAFFIDSALGLVNILWYFLLVMLTLFTMGRRSALVVSIVCIGPFVYYVHYLMYDNFHNEKLYETGSLVMIWFTCCVGLYLVYYISNQFIKSKEVAEAGLKETNKELEKQNNVIFRQKEEKELMLKEIHHRVKNNLQIINSLLRLQSRDITDPETIKHFTEAQNRIFSMALIHEKMYQANDLAHIHLHEYFTSLVNDLIETYNFNTIVTTDIKVEAVTLGTKTLVPLGLLINEVVSNSLEHGFRDRKEGEIALQLEAYKSDYRLIIGDNGIGMNPSSSPPSSLGLELIETIVEQLNGSLSQIENRGTIYEIIFEQLDED
jgi:two-component sensor histidine kinase